MIVAMKPKVVAILLFLSSVLVCWRASAQGPSKEEQETLFTVLPLIEKGQLAIAEDKLNDAVKQFPRSAILQNALGIVYLKQDKTEAAVKAFQRALEQLPNFTAAQLHLASLYQQQSKRKEAADLFAAAGLSTPNFDAQVTAGLGLAQCEDYPRAIQVLEKAHAAHPDSVSVTYNLALARYKKGEFQSALEMLSTIPSTFENQKADIFYLRGKLKQSLKLHGSEE